jgi:signal transduction histidine kinase
MRNWSVRSRILASILLVAAIGLVGAGATTFLVERDRTAASIDARLLARVEAARFVVTGSSSSAPSGQVTKPPNYATTSDAVQAVLARVLPANNETALGIIDGKARFIPGVDTAFHLEGSGTFVSQVVAQVAAGKVWMGSGQVGDLHLRYVAVPVHVPQSADTGIYVAAIDETAEFSDLNASIATYSVVAGSTLAAIAIVGWFVAGRLLQPIRQLRAAASRITASERNERIPVVGNDDVSDLTATVNEMLDRLDGAMTSQRQLLDDVRHELKTPITIVRGHLELLDASDIEDVEATRALAIEELDRMTGLVDDIESLAESRRLRPTRFAVDVADISADVFEKASGISTHKWLMSDTAHIIAAMDPARITQAWLQLVNNAAKYSPAGTTIELGSSVHGDAVEFWVSDHGPGIAPEARSRIVERFGRIDEGRGIEGSGLGLPIVKTIAIAHGGWLSLVSSSRGSRFGIVIPCDPLKPIKKEEGIAL